MYKEEPILQTPADNALIWRYMDFTKYVSLLDKGLLFFASVDILRELDKHEGSYPYPNIHEIYGDMPAEAAEAKMSISESGSQKYIAANCWHVSEHESNDMWKIYAPCGNGIAICVSFEDLKRSFDGTDEDIYVGMVKYIDRQKEKVPDKTSWELAFYKGREYESEKELRLCVRKKLQWPDSSQKHLDAKEFPRLMKIQPGPFDSTLGGIYVKTCLTRLIRKVYISRGSPEWFKELVGSIMQKYGLEKVVVMRSTL